MTHRGIDRNPDLWRYFLVKTTIDLPAPLMREVKIRAVSEGRKLKDLIPDLLWHGLDHPVELPLGSDKTVY